MLTVLGVCPEQDRIHRITGVIHRITGISCTGPSVPVHDMPVYMYRLVHVNIYMNL